MAMESYSSDSSYNAFASESSISDINSPQHFQRGHPRNSANVKCRYFMNNGYCFYGDNCQFLHVSATPNGSSRQQKHDSYISSEDDSAFISSPSFVPSTGNQSKSKHRSFQKHAQENKEHSSEYIQQQFRRMRLMQHNSEQNDSHHNEQRSGHGKNLPHLQFSSNKPDKISYFMAQQMRMELQKQRSVLLSENKDANLNLPESIENYHSLYPLEDYKTPSSGQRLFGYTSTCYRVTNSKDGLAYCMRRIHGFRLLNPKAVMSVEKWKKLLHSNIVPLKEAFTTKAFNDTSLIFIYTYYPGAETLMSRHFKGSGQRSPSEMTNNYWQAPQSTSSSTSSFAGGKSTQKMGGMPERLIWSYVIQLTAAIRMIHSQGLCCRTLDPSKVLLIGNSRLRLNCAGILDVLISDNESVSPAMVAHYQQEDLIALGKLILALSCYSIESIQRETIQQSLEFVARKYSNDLKTLIWHLLSSQVTSNPHSINEVMPMIGARFYSQLDSTQARSDQLEQELAKEMDNGRLLRILSKLGTIIERSELNMDAEWSETGDRYLLKLFRDYLFHQVTETGAAWIDFAHIVSTLNKLDAGSSERICLSSRDEASILVVSYHDLKACLETAFSELIHSSEMS